MAGPLVQLPDEQKGMRVRVHVHELNFVIPVGDGLQDMRWLALVAAARYAAKIRPKGSARQREHKSRMSNGSFLPTSVTNSDGKTQIAPSTTIRDAVLDGGEVYVELQCEPPMELEEEGVIAGMPKRTFWSATAFSTNPDILRVVKAREVERLERVVQEEKESEANRSALRGAEHEAKAGHLADIMSGTVQTPEQIIAAVEYDWENMKIDRLCAKEIERSRIKQTIIEHFVDLREAFQHYSGFGGGDETHSISFMEFSHFIHDCKIFSVTTDGSKLQKVFVETNIEKNADLDNPDRALTRFEFIEAIVRCGIYKFNPSFNEGVAPPGTETASKCFKRVLTELVLPRIQQLTAGEVREALHSHEVQAIFYDNIKAMQRVYAKYCTMDSDQSDPNNRGTMNLNEFTGLMTDAGLLGDGPGDEDELTTREARQAFAASQITDEDTDGDGIIDDEDELEELVFSEFLEAMTRVAIAKWEDPDMPIRDKVELAVDAVVVLDGN